MRHMTREEQVRIRDLYQEIGVVDILRCLAGLIDHHEPSGRPERERQRKDLLRLARELQGGKPMEAPAGKPLIEVLD